MDAKTPLTTAKRQQVGKSILAELPSTVKCHLSRCRRVLGVWWQRKVPFDIPLRMTEVRWRLALTWRVSDHTPTHLLASCIRLAEQREPHTLKTE